MRCSNVRTRRSRPLSISLPFELLTISFHAARCLAALSVHGQEHSGLRRPRSALPARPTTFRNSEMSICSPLRVSPWNKSVVAERLSP